jgi:hypothetical protein
LTIEAYGERGPPSRKRLLGYAGGEASTSSSAPPTPLGRSTSGALWSRSSIRPPTNDNDTHAGAEEGRGMMILMVARAGLRWSRRPKCFIPLPPAIPHHLHILRTTSLPLPLESHFLFSHPFNSEIIWVRQRASFSWSDSKIGMHKNKSLVELLRFLSPCSIKLRVNDQ